MSVLVALVEVLRRMICQPTATGAETVVLSVTLLVTLTVLLPRLVVKKRSHVPAIPKRGPVAELSPRLPVTTFCSEAPAPVVVLGGFWLVAVPLVSQRPVALLVLGRMLAASQTLPSS